MRKTEVEERTSLLAVERLPRCEVCEGLDHNSQLVATNYGQVCLPCLVVGVECGVDVRPTPEVAR